MKTIFLIQHMESEHHVNHFETAPFRANHYFTTILSLEIDFCC